MMTLLSAPPTGLDKVVHLMKRPESNHQMSHKTKMQSTTGHSCRAVFAQIDHVIDSVDTTVGGGFSGKEETSVILISSET